MTKLSIKNTYSDALYWATSPQTYKVKEYHIKRTEEAVLRKLIHYSRSNEKITYSNKIITEHTFIGVETLKKVIPSLHKKGFISIALIKIFDKGEPITRRTINIKWDFIQSVLDEVPAQEEAEQQTAEIDIQIAEPINEVIDAEIHSVDVVETSNITTSNKKSLDFNSRTSTYPIPDVIITNEKLNWLRKLTENPKLTKEDLQLLEPSQIRELFYNDTGIWNIDKSSKENQHLIKSVYRGGSQFSLYNKNQSNDGISLNLKDFDYTLKQRGIEFGQVTPEFYYMIKSNGLLKRPDSIKGVA